MTEGKIIGDIDGHTIVRYRRVTFVYCVCGEAVLGEFHDRKRDRFGREKDKITELCPRCYRDIPVRSIQELIKNYSGGSGGCAPRRNVPDIRASDFVVGDLKRLVYRRQIEGWGDRKTWSCCICGKKYNTPGDIVKHHTDYIRCLRVLVCKRCHKRIHHADTVNPLYTQYLPVVDKKTYKSLIKEFGIHDREGSF